MFRSEITVVLPFLKAAADGSISFMESFYLLNSFLWNPNLNGKTRHDLVAVL